MTKVILLGTGTPNIDPNRSGPSVAIKIDDSVYIIDFGSGIVRRAVQAGIDPTRLTRAFLTHLHSDHTVGYPDLIFTPAVIGRTEPLEVYGPVGLQSMTNHLLEAYKEDIHERIEGFEPAIEDSYRVIAHEIDGSDEVIYKDQFVSVEAFPVIHGSWQAFGYKFTTPDRSIVISGDTAPCDVLIEKAKGCDLLIHEVYSAEAFQLKSPEWKKYHSSVHTSSHELAEIASQSKPKRLVLYHQLPWTVTDENLLQEVKERYDGIVLFGNDLDVFQWK